MARGWESKNIEQQMEEASSSIRTGRALSAAERDRTQARDSLQLARKRLQNRIEKISAGRQRAMLEAALWELDSRLAKL